MRLRCSRNQAHWWSYHHWDTRHSFTRKIVLWKTEDELRVDGLYRQPPSFRAGQQRYQTPEPQKRSIQQPTARFMLEMWYTSHQPRICRAYGKNCLSCGKLGLLFGMCNQTQKNKTYEYRRVSAMTSNSCMKHEPNGTIPLGGIAIGSIGSTKETTWHERSVH